MVLYRAPPSTSSPQSTGPEVPGNSTYLSPRMRSTMQGWTRNSLGNLNSFAPSSMHRLLITREAERVFIRKKEYGGASPPGIWLSSRCPCLSKHWTTRAAHLSGALTGLRGRFQTERLSRLSIPPHHTASHTLPESHSASMGWCSAPLQCWGRWKSSCSSHRHQGQGGAS